MLGNAAVDMGETSASTLILPQPSAVGDWHTTFALRPRTVNLHRPRNHTVQLSRKPGAHKIYSTSTARPLRSDCVSAMPMRVASVASRSVRGSGKSPSTASTKAWASSWKASAKRS